MAILKEKYKFLKNSNLLPPNYNFELRKSVDLIIKNKYSRIALQMPDGILKYAFSLIEVLKSNIPFYCDFIILGDVCYGACNVDDKKASYLNCDFLIHYGHSCLVPVTSSKLKILYVFVDISICMENFSATVEYFKGKYSDKQIKIFGTIQFSSVVNFLVRKFNLETVQCRPLSRGEVLGCTSPKIENPEENIILFIADGRFHLESLMINNPNIHRFYRYCPFKKELFVEKFDYAKFIERRILSLEKFNYAKNIGIIFSKLGRQGNKMIMQNIKKYLEHKNLFTFYYKEIKKLDHSFIDAYVQIGCPRLSTDWAADEYSKPVLNPYEVFNGEKIKLNLTYQLDYYSREGKNRWQNYN